MRAARDAIQGVDLDGLRLGLIFAATDGGVIYTRRFFAELAEHGTQAGSPLLFPETVYNAPASHIAAALGVTGTTSTVVGDASIAVHALSMAADLVELGDCDACLVVAAEEIDWIVCEAYGAWRLRSGNGLIFSEGASAVLVGKQAGITFRAWPGKSYTTLSEASSALRLVMEAANHSTPGLQLLVNSVSGTKFDRPEEDAATILSEAVEVLSPRRVLGESFSASALGQVVLAFEALTGASAGASALVSILGWNGQCGVVELSVYDDQLHSEPPP
jgi:3-oxoacyl-[acyl-carrier-protein] synthase III